MARYDGSIRINTNINTDGIRRGESSIRGSMGRISNSAKNMMAVLASAFVVGKIVQFGKEVTKLGSELQEVENIVEVAFPNMTKAMDEFAASAANSFGLSESMAKRYTSLYGTMAKQFNFTEKEAFEMGSTLAGLAGDVASFYDISQDLAYIKLKSVFSGETETLKDIGVVMTEAALNQYALANGINKTVNKMTEQEKVALRYQFVLEQLSQASGDFVRTSDSWANQTRMLKLQIDSLKATIGQGLINIFTPVIKVINILLGKLATVANAFKAFTELITGKKSQAGTSSGISKNTGADMGAGYNEAAEGAENLAGANEKAAKSAGKAAKAAKGQLSTLDKLNNLSSQSSGSGSGGSGGSGGGGGMAGAMEDVDYGKVAEGETQLEKMGGVLDAIISKVKELAGLFKKGFFEGLGDYKPRLEELKNDIMSIGQTLIGIFTDPEVLASADRFSNQLVYSLGQVTGSIASIGITIAQNLVGGIEKYLTQNTERIKQYIISMFDIGTEISAIIGNFSVVFADIFSIFGGDTAQQITANLIGIFAEVGMLISENAAKLGRDILNMITQPIIDNKDKIKTAIEGVLQAIEPFTSGLLTAVQTVRDAVTDIYDNHLKPLFDSIANGLSEILGKLLDGYNTYIVPVLQGLGDRFKEIMEGPFGETVDKVKDFIGKLVDAIKIFWEEVLVPFFGWIASNVYPILAPIVNFIGQTVLSVLKTVVKIVGNIADSLSGVIDFLTGIFTGNWKKAWNGIKKFFKGTWDTIGDILKMNWDFIKNIVKNGVELVKAWIVSVWGQIKIVTSTVWNAIKGILTTIWNGLKALVSSVFNAIKATITNIWNAIKTVTSTIWNGIKGTLSGIWNGLKSLVSTVFNAIKTNITIIWNTIKTVTSTVWNGIKGALSAIWNSLKTLVSTIFNAIKNTISTIWNAVKTVTSTVWSGIKTTVSNIWNGLKNSVSSIFNGIKDTISGVWDSIKNTTSTVWGGIQGVIKGAVNGIIGFINSFIRGDAAGINALIDLLNKFKVEIPKGVPLVGGQKLGFNLSKINAPQIPQLATGAVIPANREFLAVLGDQKHGRNLEAPENLIRQIVREETASNTFGGEITIKIPVEVDGRVLFELMKKLDLEQYKRTGKPSFQI